MFPVFFHCFGVDKNIVQVYDDVDVQYVSEYVIHEVLEYCWCIGESKRHHIVFKLAISCAECSFPFVSRRDANEVVRMSKVDLGIDSSLTRRVKKVGNEWKWIPILLRNFVESLIVDTKVKRTILFVDKEDGSTEG